MGMSTHRLHCLAAAALVVVMAGVAPEAAAQSRCGSAVLGERAQPAVFQGIALDGSSVSRMWALGQLSTTSLANACGAGCSSLTSSPLCDGGGNCTAVTGVEWLNGTCPSAGFLPQTSVLLLETTTASDGGRWAAFKVGHNAGDANFDLDAAASAICGPSCAVLASPYVGGSGQGLQITSTSVVGSTLTVKLTWTAPSPAGQALNLDGRDLISSYGIYSRAHRRAARPRP